MIIAGIYKIQSITHPDRIYIGSAVDIHDRWKKHSSDLKLNKHHSIKLQRHYNKHGESDLQFSILLGCEKQYLIANEQFFIDTYSPYFNNRKIAGSNIGYKHSEASKQRMSIAHKNMSDETRKKIGIASSKRMKGKGNPRYGKHLSIELRTKMSESHKGFKHLEETKIKIGIASLGRNCSEERKLKISNAMKGKPRSPETRIKIGLSHIGKKFTGNQYTRNLP
jgi:group I intron endonuclease